MATTAAKAIRAQESRERLDGALGRLEKRLGVESALTAPPVPIRDPNLRAIWEVEQLADRVEALDAALKEQGYSAPAGSEGKQKPSQEPKTAPPRADKPKGRP